MREAWARCLHPLIFGYGFEFDYPSGSLPDNARRFESLGPRDTAACAALGIAVWKHLEIWPSKMEGRVRELTRYAQQKFANAGVLVLAPFGVERSHGVVVVDLGGAHKSYGAFFSVAQCGHRFRFRARK
jgi:hypothetical protein